jgi:tRNA1(Val) A37 N6-methylase TrmN6
MSSVLCAQPGLEPKRMRLVQKTVERAPWLVLIEARRGGKPSFLQVEPPLLIAGEGGGPSQALRELYERLDCGYGG